MHNTNKEQKRNIKAIERLLFNYSDIDTRIESMEIEIEIIEHNYDTLHGRGSNEIKPSTPTNQTSSTVEEHLIRKHEQINRLRNRIKMEKLNKRMIENAIKSLNDYERGLIEGRYFEHINVSDLARRYSCVREYIYMQCNKIICNKLSKYIHTIK